MQINAVSQLTKCANGAGSIAKKANTKQHSYTSSNNITNSKYIPTASALSFMGIDVSGGLKVPTNMPQKRDQIGETNVIVAGGDMTQIKADAYVVPEFDSCASEGGVGGAIIRGGAAKGMEEYNKYINENGALKFGDVVLTESGGGNSKYLLHAVTAGADSKNAFEVVEKSVYDSLKKSEEKGIKSVVIPAMGTGIIGSLTNTESANAILSGVNKFAKEGGKMDVAVVVYSTGKGFEEFADVLASKSYENAVPTEGTKEFNAFDFVVEMTRDSGESNPPAVPDMPDTPDTPTAPDVPDVPIEPEALKEGVTLKGEVCREPIEIDDELIDKLKSARGRFGMKLFSKKDIEDLIEGCKKGYYHLGSTPTKNFKEKAIAVLNNPEEVRNIAHWKSRTMGLVRAVIDPLNSTIAIDPKAFEE